MKQRRIPSDGTSSRCRRYASRRRRRARFLTTLPPSRRPTAKPTARGPGSRRQSSTNAGPSTRAPRRKSRSNSARDRSRSARGSPARAGPAPGTPLRPSAAGALWRAAASAPSGRLSSTCAHGTRASWRAADGSVGTSASRLPPRCALSAQPAHPTDVPRTASSGVPHDGRGRRGCRSPEGRAMVGARSGGRGSRAHPCEARDPVPRAAKVTECGRPRRQRFQSYPPPWISVCVTRSGRKVPHARRRSRSAPRCPGG